jgi:hypothetical protein
MVLFNFYLSVDKVRRLGDLATKDMIQEMTKAEIDAMDVRYK